MTRFLNIGFARISTILAIVLSIVYILRVVNKKYFNGENSLLKFINMVLRKRHKLIGIILIIMGLVHGIYSSEATISLNLGTASWVLSILLGASWMFRKSFKKKVWIYTGVGRGYRPGLKVEVTIKNSKITDIIIVEHNESSGYYEVPFELVPKDIIKKQSINVDTVSGATRSSNGIKEAVEEALKKAI